MAVYFLLTMCFPKEQSGVTNTASKAVSPNATFKVAGIGGLELVHHSVHSIVASQMDDALKQVDLIKWQSFRWQD